MCLQTRPLCLFGCVQRKNTLEPVSKKVQCASRTVNTIVFTHFLQSALGPFLVHFGDLFDRFGYHFWRKTTSWITSGKCSKPQSKKLWKSTENGPPKGLPKSDPKVSCVHGYPPLEHQFVQGVPQTRFDPAPDPVLGRFWRSQLWNTWM